MPLHSGLLTKKDEDAEIKMRPFKRSLKSDQRTPQQYYLRSRARNEEKQPAFVRVGPAKDDITRISNAIGQIKVDFEPFDAKAMMNHKFREE